MAAVGNFGFIPGKVCFPSAMSSAGVPGLRALKRGALIYPTPKKLLIYLLYTPYITLIYPRITMQPKSFWVFELHAKF